MTRNKPTFVYVLKSEAHWWFYVGISDDPVKRLKEHNAGLSKSTKFYAPFVLFRQWECEDREEARKQEKYLKSGVGKEYLKRLWISGSTG